MLVSPGLLPIFIYNNCPDGDTFLPALEINKEINKDILVVAASPVIDGNPSALL